MRHFRLATLLALALTGCGYKGPLYLPGPETPPPAQTTPAPSAANPQQDSKQ